MGAETRDAVDLGIAHTHRSVSRRRGRFQEIAVPLLARRQAGPFADDEIARRVDDPALAGVVVGLRRRGAIDQPLRRLGLAVVDPRRRRIVRQAAGADQRDAHVLIGEELAERGAERAHAAERGPGIGGAIDEHRQHVVAAQARR